MNSFKLSDIKIAIASSINIHEISRLNQEEYWNDLTDISEEQRFQLGKWWVFPNLLEWHMKIIQKCNGNIVLVTYNNKIIAQLDYIESIDYDNGNYFKRIHIIWLLVHKNYRKLGIAKLLISKLKQKYPNNEIWVEPEDDRSLKLYDSMGKKRKYLDNWKLRKHEFTIISNFQQGIKELEPINFEKLVELIQEKHARLLIGKYYAPVFDIMQLLHGDAVYGFIWGNTVKPKVHVYKIKELTVYIIPTQYLRIYVNQANFKEEDLISILKLIISKTFDYGFEELMIQVYKEDNLNEILRKIGFTIDSENHPIFMLNP
ncbi:MAG: GNAT family N-acetyltransferase [Candidatus Kariarchaeaceae archaeon]